MTRERDEAMMRRALKLAARGRGTASPNPMVGCVIARGSDVVGEGFHRRAGEPHAEIEAIADAGDACAGATLYVNLEPCNHTGRTGPCTLAVLHAGIARVVYGAGDPIDDHGGGGSWLAERGVEVSGGVLDEACRDLNRAFFCWARTRRPYVVLKAAASLDGKAAMASGESQWITSAEARAHGRDLRGALDAICVGIGTVLADDPQLTTRVAGVRDPLRVIVDSELRTPVTARVLPANARSGARCIVAAAESAPGERESALAAAGAEIWRLGRDRVDLGALLDRLGSEPLTGVLVEGGPTLQGAVVGGGHADELHLYLAPMALGGPARSWLGDIGAFSLDEAKRVSIVRVERIGPDLWIEARFLD